MRTRAGLLALVLALGCAPRRPPASATPPRLPAVALTTLDGKPARIEALLGGRPGLVSLWATWCEACLAELPALARLDAGLRASGRGVLIGIAVGEARDVVAPFATRRGMSWPQLCDERFAFSDALGQQRVPTTLVVDRDGAIVFAGPGLDAAAIAALDALLR